MKQTVPLLDWYDVSLRFFFASKAACALRSWYGILWQCCQYRSCEFLASTAPFHCSHFGRPVVGISHEHLRKRARGFHSGMKPCYIWITALWAVNAAVPRSTPTLTWIFVVLVTAHLFVLNVFWCWNVEYILNNSGLNTEYVRWSTLSEQKYWDYEIWLSYTTSSTAQGGGGSFKNRKRIGEIDCCEWRMSEQKHWPTDYLANWLIDWLTVWLTE